MTGHSKALGAFFDEEFSPDVLSDVQQNTRDAYRKAVRKFVGWSGCDIPIHCVTEGILERFGRALVLDGMSLKTVKAYRVYLRRIVRHKYADRCLKECGRRPNEKNPVVIAGLDLQAHDIEGSVYRFFRDQYVPRKMIGARSNSIDVIRFSIVRWGKFLGRVPMLADLTDENVCNFIGWMVGPAELSVASANSSRAHLLSQWRYAVKRGLLPEGPKDVDKLKAPKRLPEAWSMDELARIVQAAKKQVTPKTGMAYPPGLYFPAVILVAYDTGLRRRAVLGIERKGWNPERCEITVQAEVMKHSVAQTFSVSHQTRDTLQAMLNACRTDDPQTLLFPWPIRRDSFSASFKNILLRAELHNGPKDGFHKLRRTAASHLTAAVGIEAACRLMGHSSVEMTRRYVDPRFTSDHRAAEHLPRPDLNKPR